MKPDDLRGSTLITRTISMAGADIVLCALIALWDACESDELARSSDGVRFALGRLRSIK